MKRILILAFVFLSFADLRAQILKIIEVPVCWDSAGVNIELQAITYHDLNNANGVFIGYFDKKGQKRIVSDANITAGPCTALEIGANNDTTVSVYCMEVIRQMPNASSPSDTIYPGHLLQKHIYQIGTTVSITKYFDPVTQDEWTVPGGADALYLINCGDYEENDFINMSLTGDLITVPNGSSVTINPPAGRISNFEIVCNVQTGGEVRLNFTYENVQVGSQTTSVTGNRQVYLTAYANYHAQQWDYQRINEIQLTGIDQTCECSYVVSYELQKY